MHDYLQKTYNERKDVIKNRLIDFKKEFEKDDKHVFGELCFCLLTPQSKAKICWRAIEKLKETGLLYTGDQKQVKAWLGAVRFNENKSNYLIEVRNVFPDFKVKQKLIELNDPKEMREWLVKNVKGYGYKEASHFLRNVGFGQNLAILDRHILKNLVKYNVIPEFPKSLTSRLYKEIEEKMSIFSNEVGLPMDELDLLFWSEEAGEVFK